MTDKYICDHNLACKNSFCEHRMVHKKTPNCRPMYCSHLGTQVKCVPSDGLIKWKDKNIAVQTPIVAVVDCEDLYSDVWDRIQGMETDENMERWFSLTALKETMEDDEDDTNETTGLRILKMVEDLKGVDFLVVK